MFAVRMTERLDPACAINVHIAQAITPGHGIIALRLSERKHPGERSLLVALTCIADKVALIVDDGRRIERGGARDTSDRKSALDVVGRAETGKPRDELTEACCPAAKGALDTGLVVALSSDWHEARRMVGRMGITAGEQAQLHNLCAILNVPLQTTQPDQRLALKLLILT